MEKEAFIPLLSKFITVTTDDGKEISGYISNANELTGNDEVTNLNGLVSQNVPLERIVTADETSRNESVDVHVLGTEPGELTPAQVNQEIDKIVNDILHEEDMDFSINELLDGTK